MEKKNKTFFGNYFWILEAIKLTDKEMNFDKNIDIIKRLTYPYELLRLKSSQNHFC